MMSQYDHLPVYQQSFELLIHICNSIHNFPREYKYTFGEYLQKYASEALSEMSLATMTGEKPEKLIHLQNSRKQIELLKLYRRVCKEINVLSNNDYVSQLNNIVSVSRQINGWINFCSNKKPENG